MSEHVGPEGYLGLLKEIIDRWPKANDDDIERCRENWNSYLADGFEDVDLNKKIESVGRVGDIERADDRVLIEFYDTGGCLHRAVFHAFRGNQWRLMSLKFQCPVCFGEGVNDGDQCDICGGTGWGAS